MSGAYQTQALIKYDQHVSTKVIRGQLPDWMVGEEEAMCLYLGMNRTMAYKQLLSGSRSSKGAIRGDFSDYPPDICWLYNYRSCDSTTCKGRHVCHVCQGNHKGKAEAVGS